MLSALGVCVSLCAYLYILCERGRKEESALCLLAGAVCVVIWGFIQYADAGCMARDLNAEGWVDPERFPLLRRRMFSTLGNPNLFGAYLLMLISVFAPFALGERNNKRKILLAGFLFILSVCLALTYSRGAWISLAGIVLGLAVFYDKRFGLVFLAVPLILFFTMDRWRSALFLFFPARIHRFHFAWLCGKVR